MLFYRNVPAGAVSGSWPAAGWRNTVMPLATIPAHEGPRPPCDRWSILPSFPVCGRSPWRTRRGRATRAPVTRGPPAVVVPTRRAGATPFDRAYRDTPVVAGPFGLELAGPGPLGQKGGRHPPGEPRPDVPGPRRQGVLGPRTGTTSWSSCGLGALRRRLSRVGYASGDTVSAPAGAHPPRATRPLQPTATRSNTVLEGHTGAFTRRAQHHRQLWMTSRELHLLPSPRLCGGGGPGARLR